MNDTVYLRSSKLKSFVRRDPLLHRSDQPFDSRSIQVDVVGTVELGVRSRLLVQEDPEVQRLDTLLLCFIDLDAADTVEPAVQ